ncbi:hypothetical protein I302_108726 [Kwoniella bestiolae CBS 10118]|uniref:Uncharacterized protein n=1 Tax=Kwoniella bestiolae CBS 10118 TaxID=1296100 RepID=A0A1B9FTY3_9TREE|nr:hypothetical protein I302_07863 [Kwoniella bestiolae CBS 10118]OCF22218.1 hypothetical protein I302_07863 [Kwoniella bestiolae CBS 10118]
MLRFSKSSIAQPCASHVDAQVYPNQPDGSDVAEIRGQSTASLQSMASAGSKCYKSGSTVSLSEGKQSVLPLDKYSGGSMDRVKALLEFNSSARDTMETIKTAESTAAIREKGITREELKSLRENLDTALASAPPTTAHIRMQASKDDEMTVRSITHELHHELYGTCLYKRDTLGDQE